MNKKLWKAIAGGGVIAAGIGVLAGYFLFLRPWHLRWGAKDEELNEPLPGDDVKPDAGIQVTHAIEIQAPAGVIWKYLVQIGQGRGGFYSYDFIENLFGLRVHNIDHLEPELQQLKVGDFVRGAHEGWLGGRFKDKAGWYVVELSPERALVLRDEIDRGSWSFIFKPVGENTTRLVVRVRGSRPQNIAAKVFNYAFMEPAHFIMERKMLLRLKELAEEAAEQTAAPTEKGDEKEQVAFNTAAGI